MCEKKKTKTGAWIKKLNKKSNETAKKLKASTHERKIINEIIKDVRKHFNRESNFWTNRQVLDMREVFREVVVKFWVALPLERINFRVHDKIIVREAVECYSECWRERCEAFHTPEH